MINFDPTFSYGNLLALAVFVTGGLTVWYNTRAQVRENTLRIQELREMVSVTNAKASLTAERTEDVRAKNAHELAEYKLQVAKEYATNHSIRDIEDRVVAAIEKLGDRIDKLLDSRPPSKRDA